MMSITLLQPLFNLYLFQCKIPVSKMAKELKNFKNKCEKCDKSYRYKSDLIQHIKIVHEYNPEFKCEKCNKIVSRK